MFTPRTTANALAIVDAGMYAGRSGARRTEQAIEPIEQGKLQDSLKHVAIRCLFLKGRQTREVVDRRIVWTTD